MFLLRPNTTENEEKEKEFTFQYVSIKTNLTPLLSRAEHHLHSNMFLLRQASQT